MQNGDQSSAVSSGLLTRILAFIRKVPIADIMPYDIKRYSFLIRKLAHLSIFFTLGVFSCWSAWVLFHRRHIIISFMFCVLYACSDEFHQLFTSGRSAALRDVCIDSTGALMGVLFTAFIIFCIGKIRGPKKPADSL